MPEPANQPQSLSEHLAYIETCNAEPDGYYWSIDTLDGSTIGTVALTDINEYHKTAELGIVIGDKRYWGKGVATEVVRTLIAYAFEHLQLKRISAEAESENVGIQKVLKKAGFEEDGLFRSARIKNGARIDVRHFAIINNS